MHRKLGTRVCCEAVRSAILATAWLLVSTPTISFEPLTASYTALVTVYGTPELKVQTVQNAAAHSPLRLDRTKIFNHITAELRQRPMWQRIRFKLDTIVFSCFHGLIASYSGDDCIRSSVDNITKLCTCVADENCRQVSMRLGTVCHAVDTRSTQTLAQRLKTIFKTGL